jgi:GTPase
MLIDEATIYARGGKGGDGCLSFRREKFIPKGGPDGGDGGKGGDVILVGDRNLNTLLSVTHRPHKRGENGRPGRGKSMHGADGDDCIVPVPLGTLVRNAETGELIADISEHDQRVIVARGGKGGKGNEHFKSATNQTPREWTAGEDGEELTVNLELKLIADVGLVGLPNAGKSTLLRAVSRAQPKVADYPFTTLVPHLGIAQLSDERTLVIADIPGLIEGAAAGAGLGHEFLRHIERTSVLVHVVDVMPIDGSDPAVDYRTIREELAAHSQALAEKCEIIALNKIDLIEDERRQERVNSLLGVLGKGGGDVVMVSGATGEGLTTLLERCWERSGHEKASTSGSGGRWPKTRQLPSDERPRQP